MPQQSVQPFRTGTQRAIVGMRFGPFGARINGNQRKIRSVASTSSRLSAVLTLADCGTGRTVAGVGREQCSAGDVTRYSDMPRPVGVDRARFLFQERTCNPGAKYVRPNLLELRLGPLFRLPQLFQQAVAANFCSASAKRVRICVRRGFGKRFDQIAELAGLE